MLVYFVFFKPWTSCFCSLIYFLRGKKCLDSKLDVKLSEKTKEVYIERNKGNTSWKILGKPSYSPGKCIQSVLFLTKTRESIVSFSEN